MRPVDEQVAILMQGVEFGDAQTYEVMETELRERLREGRQLRVYCGYDPTAPDIHLGHTVTMRKLRQFQDLGHDVTFLIGTFTGLVGDPSDKEASRPQRTRQDLEDNARTYAEQSFKILDRDKTTIRYNADWLGPLTFADTIRLASHFTVQQFLARDNFSKRYAKGDPVWLHELFYALMQGYDAVAMETDVQIGATEQLFNLMAGRKLQEAYGQPAQICLTLPILVGTDGQLRMSKSTGNYIGIDEPPEEQYGKVMSIPDEAMLQYFRLVTRFGPARIAEVQAELEKGRIHPRDVKMQLAHEIVSIFHGDEAAVRGEEHFKTVFQQRGLPADMPEHPLTEPVNIVDLIRDVGLSGSRREARRLVEQGGVRLDGKLAETADVVVTPGQTQILQVGRRRFVRLT
ncbi:MAG: tyrosine--tRNA ligase [Ardenticatenia bacterium]|nr:tyrosine--tRNA ligase [Ardenticatenia bacterium]